MKKMQKERNEEKLPNYSRLIRRRRRRGGMWFSNQYRDPRGYRHSGKQVRLESRLFCYILFSGQLCKCPIKSRAIVCFHLSGPERSILKYDLASEE
jgi:hypothetical protein